jgi:hypothetical protein
MRITIQVTCDTPEDAKDAINRLTRPANWTDKVDIPEKPEVPPRLGGETVIQTRPNPIVRGNVDPGKPSIGKIGAKAREEIMETLKEGNQPDPRAYREHCKLLWSRGELKYDGERYYT